MEATEERTELQYGKSRFGDSIVVNTTKKLKVSMSLVEQYFQDTIRHPVLMEKEEVRILVSQLQAWLGDYKAALETLRRMTK